MTRSRKKPYYTDQNTASPGRGKQAKRDANKAVRKADDIADGKQYRKISDSWNISDWSFHCPKDKKAYRK